MNPAWIITEGCFYGIVFIYSLVQISETRRFPNYINYPLGCLLMVMCCLNYAYFNYVHTALLYFGSLAVISFALNKDRLRQRITIFLAFAGMTVVVGLLSLLIAYLLGILPLDSDKGSARELFYTFSTTLFCDICLISVMAYRRRRQKMVAMQTILLALIPLLILLYLIVLIVDEGNHSLGLSVTTGILAILINQVLVLLFIRFITASKRVYMLAKEKELMEQVEGFDRNYFELVQGEIDKVRFIRHDVINYTEQIRALAELGDSGSMETAGKLMEELEARLAG